MPTKANELAHKAAALEQVSIRVRLTQEEIDAAPSMRSKLPGLKEMGWRSDKVVEEPSSIEDMVGHLWQTFTSKTEEIELEILYGAKRVQCMEAFQYLADVSEEVPSKATQEMVINYILCLTIIDRHLWLHEVDQAATRRDKKELNRTSGCDAHFRIDSVKALAQTFRSTVSGLPLGSGFSKNLHSNLLQSPPSAELESSSRVPRGPRRGVLDQVVALGQNFNVQKYTKIEENIAIAALYVSYMFSGADNFAKFLDGIEEINANNSQNPEKKMQAENALKTLRKSRTQPRRPLLYSALISVLTLLVPHKLATRPEIAYNEWQMLQEGMSLGCPNIYPIRNAERAVWNAVFQVADNELSVRDAVGTLLDEIPFGEIENLSDKDDQALQFDDVVAQQIGNGVSVMNNEVQNSVFQSCELEGRDDNDEGPVLVIVKHIAVRNSSVSEELPQPQQLHYIQHATPHFQDGVHAKGVNNGDPEWTGGIKENTGEITAQETSIENSVPVAAEHGKEIDAEIGQGSNEGTSNADLARLAAEIFAENLSDTPDSTTPSNKEGAANADVPVLSFENIEDLVLLSDDEKKTLRLWSVGEICDREMPKVVTISLRSISECFSQEEPTVTLESVFSHSLPPAKFVHTLKARAEEAVRAGQRSILLAASNEPRFPLNAIGAWDVIHSAVQAKSLWDGKNTGQLWVMKYLDEDDVSRMDDLMMQVPWDGSMDALYGRQPYSVLSGLLSDSSLNDNTVNVMLSLLVVRIKELRISQKALFGITHTSFAQCLLQLPQEDYRKRYPSNPQPVLMRAGKIFEQEESIKLYGVANSRDQHWAAFCIAKTSNKIIVTWADSLKWTIPENLYQGLRSWLGHHCPNIPVEVDTQMIEHGVQEDSFSCGVVAVNALKHHFLGKELWVPEKSRSLRLEEFEGIVNYCLSEPHRQPSISHTTHWFPSESVAVTDSATQHLSSDEEVDELETGDKNAASQSDSSASSDIEQKECLSLDEEMDELETVNKNAAGQSDLSPPSDIEDKDEQSQAKTGPNGDKQIFIGKKRLRLASSGDSSPEMPEESEKEEMVVDHSSEEPNAGAGQEMDASLSRPRRSTRDKPPLTVGLLSKGNATVKPPKKKKKPTTPKKAQSTAEVEDADDEADDVKPRLWMQQNSWMGTVSSMLKDMEDVIMADKAMGDNEGEEDTKFLLKVDSADDKHVVSTKTFLLFDITGRKRDFTFKFTDSDEALLFDHLMDATERSYVNGKPRFLSAPETSAFRIMDYKKYLKDTPMEMLTIFGKQTIVVKDYPSPQVSWTPEAIAKFGFVNQQQTIYDLSLPKTRPDRDGTEKPVRRDHWGTLGMLYDCSQKLEPRKPLLSLDNNMPAGKFWHDGAEKIATDLIGFNSVMKHPEGVKLELPWNDLMWTLFATAGAWSLSHIDADGAATLVQPCHGTKLWFIIRGPSPHSPHIFAWPAQFNPPWELDRANFWTFLQDHTQRHLLTVEVMVVEGLMRLLMPPNTPHAVLSPTNSIFQGGHFYALSTMRDTLAGLVHMLVQERFITNTNHPQLRMMIRKVVAYVHAIVFPSKAKVDSSQCFNPAQLDNVTMTYLFAAISLGFLSNILDPRTYRIRPDDEEPTEEELAVHDKYDYNAMPASERRGCIWTRGMAVDLAGWFCAKYELRAAPRIERDAVINPDVLVCDAIAHEAFGIFVAVKCVEAVPARKDMCAVGATSDNIRYQLEHLDNKPEVEKNIKLKLKQYDEGSTPKNFNLLYDWSNWTCCAKRHQDEYVQLTDEEIMGWGCTTRDKAYMTGEKCQFKMD